MTPYLDLFYCLYSMECVFDSFFFAADWEINEQNKRNAVHAAACRVIESCYLDLFVDVCNWEMLILVLLELTDPFHSWWAHMTEHDASFEAIKTKRRFFSFKSMNT